jgi:hypothetical protein
LMETSIFTSVLDYHSLLRTKLTDAKEPETRMIQRFITMFTNCST